jgi:hypothetical protein
MAPTKQSLLPSLALNPFTIMRSPTSVAGRTVQHTAETPAATTTAHCTPTENTTMGSNGPTCAHCGWRGGGHAKYVLVRLVLTTLVDLAIQKLPIQVGVSWLRREPRIQSQNQ